MPQAIRLTGLSKRFAATEVLHDIHLNIEPGEFLTLLGPSGCGKSTLLRIVAGLEAQTAGTVSIGDHTVDHLTPRERNLAMVFQNYALYPHLSVRDNIAMPLMMSRLSLLRRQPYVGRLFPGRQAVVQHIDDEVAELADTLGLADFLQRKPGQLSGGQRQRVALARAMVRRPAAFLMDEPLSNLDARLRVQMRDELADLHRKLGATFVYVTHDQTEAMSLSTRVAVMQQGRILQVAAPDELYARPANLDVARFVGTPAINVLPLLAGDGAHRLAGEWPVALRGHVVADLNELYDHGGHVGIRPEHLALAVHGEAFSASVDASLPGTLRQAEHHGAEWVCQVHVPRWQAVLQVRVPQRQWHGGRAAHQLVRLGWQWCDMQVFDRHQTRRDIGLHGHPEAAPPAAQAAFR
jgi:multiple sugar transport system ATP-binding protein